MDTTKPSRLLLVPEPADAAAARPAARAGGTPRVRRFRLARVGTDAGAAPPRRP